METRHIQKFYVDLMVNLLTTEHPYTKQNSLPKTKVDSFPNLLTFIKNLNHCIVPLVYVNDTIFPFCP